MKTKPQESHFSKEAGSVFLETIAALKKQQIQNSTARRILVSLPKPWKKQIHLLSLLSEYKSVQEEEEKWQYELSNRDIRIKCVMSGFLVIHVLELLKIFVHSKCHLPGIPLSMYVVVKIGPIQRNSTVYSSNNLGRVRVDSVFHLPIQVSEWRDNLDNFIRMEVWGFQDPETHFMIGHMKEHIYSFIKNVHGIQSTALITEHTSSGQIVFEYAFAYGTLGYGYSNQLKNPDSHIFEGVNRSIFPRIRLAHGDQVTNNMAVRTPSRLHTMTKASFIQEMPPKGIVTRSGQKIAPEQLKEPKKIIMHKVDYEDGIPIHCYAHMKIWQTPIQADFNDAYGDYVCLTHRRDRMQFVEEMTNGRLCDLREMEAGAIFSHMNDADIQKVIKAGRHTDTLIYPEPFSCSPPKVVKLTKEDEHFMDRFPYARRTTGYLGQIFLADEENGSEQCEDNDMRYPAYLEAGKTKSARWLGGRMLMFSLRDFFRHVIQSLVSCHQFLFPPLTANTETLIPEISVSLASPSGSTVDLYSYFINNKSAEEPSNANVNLNIQELTKRSEAVKFMSGDTAPNYGDIIGMDVIETERDPATIRQSMMEAHVQ